MKMDAYGGDKIEVEVNYRAKGQWNPRFALVGENGVYSLRYDDNALYALGISIRVPKAAHIGGTSLKNRNAPISADGVTAGRIELDTKNAPIKAGDVNAEYLICKTRNAPITLDDINVREIEAQTSNSKITLDDAESQRARLVTSNAKIEVKDSAVSQLYATTSNASLQFDKMSYNGQEPVCGIEAITSNGKITVNLPGGKPGCRLRASTTHGGIFSELRDLEYHVNERNYIEAQSHGYDEARSKVDLNLQTTNGGIYING